MGASGNGLPRQVGNERYNVNDLHDELGQLPWDLNGLLSKESQQNVKVAVINGIENLDLSLLSKLGCTKYGFVTNSTRQESWHKILMAQYDCSSLKFEWKRATSCKDASQISLDVQRSFAFVNNLCQKAGLRTLLEQIILRVFENNPRLCYFQGYHDIVSIFVLVYASDCMVNFGETSESFCKLLQCVESFTLIYLRDFVMESLEFTLDQIRCLPSIIESKSPALARSLQMTSNDVLFALPYVLTLFSHVIPTSIYAESGIIFEIFDLIISSQCMRVPVILLSNIIIAVSDDLIREVETQNDFFKDDADMVGVVYSKVLGTFTLNGNWNLALEMTRSDVESRRLPIFHSPPPKFREFNVNYTTAIGTYEKEDGTMAYSTRYFKRAELQKLIRNQIESSNKASKQSQNPQPSGKYARVPKRYIPILLSILVVITAASTAQKHRTPIDEILNNSFNILTPATEQIKGIGKYWVKLGSSLLSGD